MLDLLPLPITWLLFYVLGRMASGRTVAFRQYLLAGGSLALLFGATGWQTGLFFTAMGLMFSGTAVLLSRLPNRQQAKRLLVFSLIASVMLILVYLRFRPYFGKQFSYLPSLSYLGFRGIACLVSAYSERRVTLGSGVVQMFFFPSLFMGPISRVENFFETQHDYRDVLRRLLLGLSLLIAGHFVSRYVPQGRLDVPDASVAELWVGAVASSFDYYFMFSGYSHLIIGLGLLAGFKLPENFNYPYIASSLGDFWRRWHMSLSFWIRDYVYIPLGGNRRGVARKCLNLSAAMAACGVWHGLDLHYLAWGLFHGLVMSVESVMAHYHLTPIQRLLPRYHQLVKVAFTFSLVTFSWILFRYDIPIVAEYLKGMFGW